MLTQSLANRIAYLVSVLNTLGALPFRIHPTEGHFYVHFVSHFRVLHLFLWFIAYVLIEIPTNLYTLWQTNQIKEFNYTVLIWLFTVCSCNLFGVLALRPHGFCQFLNSLFKFLEEFQSKYVISGNAITQRKQAKYYKIAEECLFSIFLGCFSVGVLMSLDCFIRPRAPAYHLFAIEERFLSWPVYFIGCGWFTLMAICIASAFGFLAYCFLLIFLSLIPIIKNEMRFKKTMSYRTNHQLRKNINNLLVNWRSMEIIVTILNTELMYNCIMYLQGVFTCVVLFSIVTLTYQWETSGVVVNAMLVMSAIVVVGILCCILLLAGFMCRLSEKTIRSWKKEYWMRNHEWVYLKKAKRACRPFSVGDGRRYVIRPKTVLLFLSGLSRNTCRALVAYGKLFGCGGC